MFKLVRNVFLAYITFNVMLITVAWGIYATVRLINIKRVMAERERVRFDYLFGDDITRRFR